MITEAIKSGRDSYLTQRELLHERIYELHNEGLSPVEISDHILYCEKLTDKCSVDCVRENLRSKYGVEKFNRRKLKNEPNEPSHPKKAKKRERKNSLGPSDSWDRTIRILSLVLNETTQGDVKRLLKTHGQSVSRIVGNATAAGFNCDPYVGTKNGTVNNALMRSIYLLKQGWAIKAVAKEVHVYAHHLRKIEKLMKKHHI